MKPKMEKISPGKAFDYICNEIFQDIAAEATSLGINEQNLKYAIEAVLESITRQCRNSRAATVIWNAYYYSATIKGKNEL